jgi:hypothetical protein
VRTELARAVVVRFLATEDAHASRPSLRGPASLCCSSRQSLTSLFHQLLYSIHLISLSPSLPHVSRHLSSLFSLASPHHRAWYLLLRHGRHTLSRAIKYPICDLTVVHSLERLVKQQGKQLRCSELPRRLVKGLGKFAGSDGDDETHSAQQDDHLDLPLITYLLETYSASPNSKHGYILARAVFARHYPLIRLLLKHGADPAMKDGWAVMAAIGMGDLDLVRLLMEREVNRDEGDDGEEAEFELSKRDRGTAKKRRRDSGGGGGGKRRRMEERCAATSEMLQAAVKGEHWRIVDYLTERGELGVSSL